MCLNRYISYYTRAKHYLETRRDYKLALEDSLKSRSKVELEQKGGATVEKHGLSIEQKRERQVMRRSMHFKVYTQQYDIYNKMGEDQLANTRQGFTKCVQICTKDLSNMYPSLAQLFNIASPYQFK